MKKFYAVMHGFEHGKRLTLEEAEREAIQFAQSGPHEMWVCEVKMVVTPDYHAKIERTE